MFDIEWMWLKWLLIIITGLVGCSLGTKLGISITKPPWLKEGFWQKYPLPAFPSSKKWCGAIFAVMGFNIVIMFVMINVGLLSLLLYPILEFLTSLIMSLLLPLLPAPGEEATGVASIIEHIWTGQMFSPLAVPFASLLMFIMPFISAVIYVILLDWVVSKTNKRQKL